ncbi:hypothetical protein IC620_03475 [Hazenella sp. IB182357]|uniref:Uncharacterized protein n=1 Tax=Polycladospora coralii TaxID=2771432 RepID=A0A926RTP3_9BACL|nr:hypothetical protein [Polycladospora coralii]MBD1371414.1 hypothetical protein [Polycladospora coralii]MBS7530382.1 hypothetical protein [Polycladospora coralii]
MDSIAYFSFQALSILAILLPILGGGAAIYLLWRGVKALEGVNQQLADLKKDKKRA